MSLPLRQKRMQQRQQEPRVRPGLMASNDRIALVRDISQARRSLENALTTLLRFPKDPLIALAAPIRFLALNIIATHQSMPNTQADTRQRLAECERAIQHQEFLEGAEGLS